VNNTEEVFTLLNLRLIQILVFLPLELVLKPVKF